MRRSRRRRPRAASTAATAAAVLVLALAGTSVATAAAPVTGGRYVDATTAHGARASIELTIANDGGELAAPSRVRLHEACTPTEELIDAFRLDGRLRPASRAVRIGRDGRFSRRVAPTGPSRRSLTLVGRFAGGGRVAVGTARIREDRPCRGVTFRFRARMTGRPDAPTPGRWASCDPVVTGWFDFPSTVSGAIVNVSLGNVYDVHDRGAGCTAARELARRWDASLRCRELLPGGTCAVASAACSAIRGGRASPQSSASCIPARRPSARVELVHLQPCTPPPTTVAPAGAWAINADCDAATAFPFESLLPDASGHGPCGAPGAGGRFACAPVAGYRCTGRVLGAGQPPPVTVRCVDVADPYLALRLTSAPRNRRPTGTAASAIRPRRAA